jgi:hypothetical protein
MTEAVSSIIGDTEIRIDGDDIIVGDKVYEGTPGLWELTVSKNPSDEIYTLSDKEKYIRYPYEHKCIETKQRS